MAGKRSFQQTVRPFSDSRAYVQYGDCRRKRQRYEYSDGGKAAFVESSPQRKRTPPEVPIGRPSLAAREVVAFINAHTADGSYDIPSSSSLFRLYNLPPASTKTTLAELIQVLGRYLASFFQDSFGFDNCSAFFSSM